MLGRRLSGKNEKELSKMFLIFIKSVKKFFPLLRSKRLLPKPRLSRHIVVVKHSVWNILLTRFQEHYEFYKNHDSVDTRICGAPGQFTSMKPNDDPSNSPCVWSLMGEEKRPYHRVEGAIWWGGVHIIANHFLTVFACVSSPRGRFSNPH